TADSTSAPSAVRAAPAAVILAMSAPVNGSVVAVTGGTVVTVVSAASVTRFVTSQVTSSPADTATADAGLSSEQLMDSNSHWMVTVSVGSCSITEYTPASIA